MLKGSDLWLCLWLWRTDSLWKYLYGGVAPTSFEMVLRVIKQTSLYIFVKCKSQRASELHNCFKSYGIFAWICLAESNDYSAHRHCGNCNLTSEIPNVSTRPHQNPIKAIGPLCCKCHRLEVLKKLLQSNNSDRNGHGLWTYIVLKSQKY